MANRRLKSTARKGGRRKRKRPSMRPWIARLSALRRSAPLPWTVRGRRFTLRGIRTIMRCVAEHYGEGRTRISEVVCIRLGWRQPNGWPKDRACRDALRRLERLRIIKLPPRISTPTNKKLSSKDPNRKKLLLGLLVPVTTMPQTIELELAKTNAAETLWNALVEKHHYLGHRVQVGRCLKYLIRGDGQLLGAISFSSPAWRLAARDELLRHIGIMGPRAARDFVINNSRFLILPTVRVPHLASRILSEATRRAVFDWTWYYSIEPVLAETFVEPNRFEGTCYRAANWAAVGTTNGYAKNGSSHHNSQRPKTLFVYGLSRHYRRKLAAVLPSLNLQPDDGRP